MNAVDRNRVTTAVARVARPYHRVTTAEARVAPPQNLKRFAWTVPSIFQVKALSYCLMPLIQFRLKMKMKFDKMKIQH